MSKLIITVSGRPNLFGYKQREFKWSEKHKAFVYDGRELSDMEFNAVYEKAIRNNADMNPRVRVVEFSDGATEAAAPTPAPIATIAREFTLEEAEAVVQRLAPDRLKKKTGPKPMMEVA